MRIIVLASFLILFSSCEKIQKLLGGKEQPIARVFDQYLYPSDLVGVVPAGTSKEDSIAAVDGYVENWIRQTVILRQAQENVALNQTEIEEQLENYRQSLIIYSYEQQLVAQELDTSVAESELKKYYEENKENFQLKQSIVKASYAKILKDAPRIDVAKKWFVSSKSRDREELETFCMQFAPEYSLVDTSWIILDNLAAIFPLDRVAESTIMQENNFITLSDERYLYLLKVRDYMYKEDYSPFEFERENIKNIIINKRKVALVNKMENDIFQKARGNNDVELYKNEK